MFPLRPYRPDTDAALLEHLHATLAAADQGQTPLSLPSLRAQLRWLQHDPAQDHWLAQHPSNPGEVIGETWVIQQMKARCLLSVQVHPAWRRKGLGSALLEQALTRARAYEAEHVVAFAHQHHEPANAFLRQHHFHPAGDAWILHARLDGPIPEPEFPPGYYLLPHARFNHLPTLSALLHRCYHDKFAHAENITNAVKAEDLRVQIQTHPEDYPGETMFLLFNMFGKAVGFVRARGHILDAPGVVPEERTSERYLSLARLGMRTLREQGLQEIELHSVGDDQTMMALYGAAGFSIQHRYFVYQKEC